MIVLKSGLLSRIAGILMLGVFGVNVYIGLYDKVLAQAQPNHVYLNWVIAVLTLVGAGLLLAKPTIRWVTLGGIVWPIIYVAGLAVDVLGKLCIGGDPTACWPTRRAAFDYLILNDPNPPAGWTLWQGTIPTALALLFIAWVLSIYFVVRERRMARIRKGVVSSPESKPAESGPMKPAR